MNTIPNNLFFARDYVISEPSSGLLSSPMGKRLIAVPDLLLESIQQTLIEEAGQASVLALYTFGYGWGKSFFERTRKEMENYHQSSLSQINGVEFFALMQELWRTHGLGKTSVCFSRSQEGILQVTIVNSGISKLKEEATPKSFSLEAGLVAGWFSGMTQRNLKADAITWCLESKTIVYSITGLDHVTS